MWKSLGVLVISTLVGCGGGGGGGGSGLGYQPLTTSVVAFSSSGMSYSVSGSYETSSGRGAVSGSMSVLPLGLATVHGVTYGHNAQTFASLAFGGSFTSSTTRSYGDRFDALGLFSQGARRLPDGTDVYWDVPIATGPTTYSIGASWDLELTSTPDLVGFEDLTDVPRLALTEWRWAVVGVDVVQTPIGAYECYVLSAEQTIYDDVTGILENVTGTYYVRPELGVLYFAESSVGTDGVDIVSVSVVAVATGAP